MKFQLAAQHYIEDRLLEPGTIVGDETPYSFRYSRDVTQVNKEGRVETIKAGSPMTPSREMIPLDEEAKQLMREAFPAGPAPADPTASIPIRGTGDEAKAPGPAAPRGSAVAHASPPKPSPTPATGMHAKPAGHDSSKNPGDSKDTETAKAPDIKKL